ncbi:response regulator [Geobacillus sp. Y412MC52]|uniref:response regulator n=1 Tax=Geobacillus sp. (strain Y412MC52) TaxID=550542 RepID=UPI000A06EB5C|nr:response regulator [Geobacillus sp. Y412MC52]
MDIRFKGKNGLLWIRKIASLFPACKVVILSRSHCLECMNAAYEAGAYAFCIQTRLCRNTYSRHSGKPSRGEIISDPSRFP